ncbi:hypothetical protein N7510_004108 [Penicillium lagena]|uniref:uncharacterized protein n=1 Tax=Penicillium lagena TaxID=94218 RepID=UPI002541BF49|nr:uncharacterized protein N7510_004108 [Penicillium lagena]KAJ5620124.1 hypothetical protein N7510_004108 [Penicillium lagena]
MESPSVDNAEPKPARAATFPGAIASDGASGSSGSQHESQRNSRRMPAIGGPLVRNSTAQTLQENRTESSAIDPLSQHIIQRTNTQKSIPLKLLGKASYEAEAGGSEQSLSEQGAARGDAPTSKLPREKKKGVSFLSRIIGAKKKDALSEVEDESSEVEASRMSVDTSQPIGFIPRHPAPSRYLKVRAQYKKDKIFNRVFLAQELEGTDAPVTEGQTSTARNGEQTERAVWAMEFSQDGKYLAAAGQDRKVRVWAVIATPDEREEADREGNKTSNDKQEPPRLKAWVFQPKPVQVYEGHTGSILDVSWSKNSFILSSSMDKTVRLWHTSRPECLCCFQHSDFVTSIQFHPTDDRFFLAGSLDTKLRLWSIPDKSVAFVTTLPDMITAVAFTPDGKHAIAGCLNGLLNIYETEGLRFIAQIHVRSARGRNAKGSKITGIDAMQIPADDSHGDIKLLITSNDSRIRMYDLRERSLEAKFRGNENACSQIRASFMNDGKHIICGSEDRRAYVWPVGPVERDADKRAVEVFETQSAIVTAAIAAPVRTKQLLGLSEDPIYDICNPPPVALMTPAEYSKQEIPAKENGNGHSRTASAPRLSVVTKMAHESPSYLMRSTHPDGNIIIIADYSGKIKVLRQDCAFQKRRYENWDSHSTSRRLLGRSNSARRSIASSTGKESAHKTPSERIISWRNSVHRHGRPSTEGSRSGFRSRSTSPQQQQRQRVPTLRFSTSRPSSLGPNESLAGTTTPPQSPRRPLIDSVRSSEDAEASNSKFSYKSPGPSEPRDLPASSADLVASGEGKDNPLWLQGDQSYAFWNKITHDALAARSRQSNDFLSPNRFPSGERKTSTAGSVLSSDYGSSKNGEEEDDGRDVLRCDNCRGTNFRSVKGRHGKQRLICAQCHRPVT